MTGFEYRLLSRIANAPLKADQTFSADERAALAMFQKRGVDWVRLTANLTFVITDKGRMALRAYEEQLQKDAEAKAEQEAKEQRAEAAANKRWRKDSRRSWFQFWLGVIFGAIGFAAGVFVEHYFTVLDLLFAIFGLR